MQEKNNTLYTQVENLSVKLNTKTIMLERMEEEKQSILDLNKDKVNDLKDIYKTHIEHISMQLEDITVQCNPNLTHSSSYRIQ